MNQPVPAKIVPEVVPSLRTEGEVKVFSRKQLAFLKAYSGCMDEDQAAIEAGIDKKHLNEVMNEPHVKREMANIQKVWQYQPRLTAGFAAAKHMQLMEEFENDYRDPTEKDNKPKMAGVLAKMSEASMKATGLIGQQHSDTMPTVILNLNTSGVASPEIVTVTSATKDLPA